MDKNVSNIIFAFVILIEFFLLLYFEKFLILYLKKRHAVQFVRDEMGDIYKIKEGTPRGGGIVFLLAPIFFLPFNHSKVALFVASSVLLFGIIGLIDDVLTFKKHSSDGLSVRNKLILHFLATLILFVIFKDIFSFNVKFLSFDLNLGWFIYFILFLTMFIGSANAFNLTDGVDGLLGSVTVTMLLLLSLIANTFGNTSHLYLILVFIIAILAFLWFNSPKASIFMGDVGSGALGALVASLSIILKIELYLPIIAIIPVIEALSIFIQITYFKRTHGKRIFKMTPIHHHFELSGLSEAQIDFRFSIITLVASIVVFFLKLYFG